MKDLKPFSTRTGSTAVLFSHTNCERNVWRLLAGAAASNVLAPFWQRHAVPLHSPCSQIRFLLSWQLLSLVLLLELQDLLTVIVIYTAPHPPPCAHWPSSTEMSAEWSVRCMCEWSTCIVLCQIFIFGLLLLLAKPGAAGLLLLLGLLHGDARHSPAKKPATALSEALEWKHFSHAGSQVCERIHVSSAEVFSPDWPVFPQGGAGRREIQKTPIFRKSEVDSCRTKSRSWLFFKSANITLTNCNGCSKFNWVTTVF